MSLLSRLKLPKRDELLASRWLRPFAGYLSAGVLWHWNRRGVARGVALGLFFGILLPLLQTPAAAVFAVAARANLAVAAVCTLVTNPLTTPLIYVAAYQLGGLVLRIDAQTRTVRGDWFDDAISWLAQASLPTALGLLILSSTAAALGYGAVHVVWRWRVMRRWQRRRETRRLAMG